MSDPARRARLNAIKLTALVRDHLGGEPVLEPGEFAVGAALVHDGAAWVLLADQPERGLGGALAWALRRGAGRVHVVADEGTGVLARRAAGFTFPISVWHVDGRALLPAVAEPLPAPVDVPAGHHEFEPLMVVAGAEPRIEFGVLAGEVWGLEVCRVVDDAFTGTTRLEVGVGEHDREAFLMLHGDRPTAEALADVVRAVGAYRRPGAAGHPLNRLAQERALRARLVADPSLVGATRVEAVAPPVPRSNLKDPVPCVALATIDGERCTVVCTAGVDLDAVPFAVDARHATGVERCVLAMPRRDAIDLQRTIAGLATPPIGIVPVD